jgi:hypothetical protein
MASNVSEIFFTRDESNAYCTYVALSPLGRVEEEIGGLHQGQGHTLDFIPSSGRAERRSDVADGDSRKPAGTVDTNCGDIDDAFAIKHSGGARSQSANCSAARISVISIRIVAVE